MHEARYAIKNTVCILRLCHEKRYMKFTREMLCCTEPANQKHATCKHLSAALLLEAIHSYLRLKGFGQPLRGKGLQFLVPLWVRMLQAVNKARWELFSILFSLPIIPLKQTVAIQSRPLFRLSFKSHHFLRKSKCHHWNQYAPIRLFNFILPYLPWMIFGDQQSLLTVSKQKLRLYETGFVHFYLSICVSFWTG